MRHAKALWFEHIHHWRKRQCLCLPLRRKTRYRFEVVSGEMILADEMVAVLDELLHPQCRETSVTATTGGGQRDVNLLTLYLRRGLHRRGECQFHAVRLFRHVTHREYCLDQIFSATLAGIVQLVPQLCAQRTVRGRNAFRVEPRRLCRHFVHQPTATREQSRSIATRQRRPVPTHRCEKTWLPFSCPLHRGRDAALVVGPTVITPMVAKLAF